MLYRFYVGLNDKDEHIQVISDANAIKIIKREFVAATVATGFGIWMGEIEPCLVIDIIEPPGSEPELINKMKFIKDKLNQDFIYMVKLNSLKEELI